MIFSDKAKMYCGEGLSAAASGFTVEHKNNTYIHKGLTKLEWMAGQVAAGLFSAAGKIVASEKDIVDCAKAILEECEKQAQ